MILFAGRNKLYKVIFADGTINNLEISYNASEGVEHRVEYQSLQRRLGVTFGSGDSLYNRFENILYSDTGFAAGTDNV